MQKLFLHNGEQYENENNKNGKPLKDPTIEQSTWVCNNNNNNNNYVENKIKVKKNYFETIEDCCGIAAVAA